MKLGKMHWFGIIAGFLIVLSAIVFFRAEDRVMFFLAGIGVFIVFMPFVIGFSLENVREQKINEMFLEFTRNLAESVSAGTPVSKSIINMSRKNYGVLTPYVIKLANQIELGIPVQTALRTFGEDVNSSVIKRALALIREAERAGGEIDYILDSTAHSIAEVEKLKKERRAAISSLVVQGYIIFFIFIGIILVMQFRILPLTMGLQGLGGITSGNLNTFDRNTMNTIDCTQRVDEMSRPFLFLLMTQGFFAGLVIGKLSEGSLKSGLKHSFILTIVSFLISTGAVLFIGSPTCT